MSDVRLSSITVDPLVNSLNIRNGSVTILSTASSTALSSALFINGGLTIGSTINSSNLTSGGSITSLGGMSILKDIRLGGSMVLDSVSGTFSIGGISNNRIFVDTVSNKQILFAPDGQTNSLIINDTSLQVLPITPSTSSSSGSLIVSGGVGIRNSTNATSITSGGALTIAGGIAVKKDLLVGQTIHGNAFLSDTAYDITGPGSQPVGGIEIQDNGGVGIYSTATSYFSAPGFRFWTGSTAGIFLTINSSATSFSTDTVSISGITNIVNTIDSTSISTGALTINGGVGIAKSLVVGNVIGISPTTDSSQKLVLYGSLNNPNSFTGFATSNLGNLKLQTTATSNDLIVSASTSEIFRIKGSTKEIYLGGLFTSGSNQSYTLRNINNDITLSGLFPGSPSNLSLFSANSDGTTSVSFKLFNKGSAIDSTNSEYLELGSDTTNYYLTAKQTGTGNLKDLVLADNLSVSKQNSFVTINSTKTSTNSTTAGLIVNGGISIKSTVNATSFTAGGALTIAGGTSIAKDLFVGNNVNVANNLTAGKLILGTSDIYTSINTLTIDTSQLLIASTSANLSNPLVTNGSYNTELRIYGLGSINSANGEWLEVGTNNSSSGFSIITKASGTGLLRPINLGNAITISSGGITASTPVLVNNISTFGNNMLINGNLQISSGGNLLLGTDTSITSGNLMLTGTNDSVTVSSGALVVSGGIGVVKKIRTGDSLFVKNGSWTSNGNDISINSNGDSIYFRNTSGSTVNQLMYNGTNGSLTVNSSIDSTNGSTGAMVVLGGLSVSKRAIVVGGITAGSSSFTNVSSANIIAVNNSVGTLTVSGTSTIGTNLIVNGTSSLSGVVSIINTIDSIDSSTGSLIVSGGVGIRKNLSVGGDTVLSGNLTVNGTTTTINSQNQLLKDNIFIMNSGPVGSRDSGFVIQRYQTSNDSSSGDVVADSPVETYTLGLQSGATSSQIILPSGANSSNNYYNGWWIRIGSGFSAGQVRQITGYTGSTRIAQVGSPFTTQNPANGDTVALYNKPYVGLIYRESSDLFSFTGLINDTSVSSTGLIGIESSNVITGIITTGSLIISSTVDSVNTGTGSVIMSGGMGINKNLNVGGDLTVNGVNITPTYGDLIKVQTFTGAQGASNASITGLLFNTVYTGAFDIFLMIRITATVNRFANYHIRGIWKGGTTFETVSSYVGDDLGISFGITTDGQITYTSPSYSGFSNMTMRFRAYTL